MISLPSFTDIDIGPTSPCRWPPPQGPRPHCFRLRGHEHAKSPLAQKAAKLALEAFTMPDSVIENTWAVIVYDGHIYDGLCALLTDLMSALDPRFRAVVVLQSERFDEKLCPLLLPEHPLHLFSVGSAIFGYDTQNACAITNGDIAFRPQEGVLMTPHKPILWNAPYFPRPIRDEELMLQWADLDTLYADPDTLSPFCQRQVEGFCAAGGSLLSLRHLLS